MSYRPTRLTTILLFLVACHTDRFLAPVSVVGPSSAGPDVLLTYNSDQDYWPTWTKDGSGILYAFIDATQVDLVLQNHRCVGLLPVTGGTRFWQWRDNRADQGDSISSIPAVALGADGRLLYLEATTPIRSPFIAPTTVLWLADSATPFRRRALLKFPVTVGDSLVTWLADLRWTGPTTFVATGQRMVLAGHCGDRSAIDSVFYGQMIIAGTIDANGATLTPVAGTTGATSYSLAENGSSIVFTQRDSTNLMRVPVGGGVPTTIPATPRTGVQLFGVSCRGTTCVVTLGPVTLWQGPANIYGAIHRGAFELRTVSLATGQTVTILSRDDSILASPLLAASGDMVAQFGTMFGHLQTFGNVIPQPRSDLHLYKSLVP